MENDKNAVKKETGLGTIRVADEVVSIIAGLATTEVEGVAGMSGGIAVALAAQENVKRAIETMTGLSVIEVNVHVQGVGFPEEEPKAEESRVR